MTEAQRNQLPEKQAGGRAALAVMERNLGGSDWFGGDAMGIADFALYAYTHVANEGGSTSRTTRPSAPGSDGSRSSRGTSR